MEGAENASKYETFEDFAKVLGGHDNITVADIEGDYPGREKFMRALIQKARIQKEVTLSAPNRVQPFCALTKDGKIYIEVLGEVTTDNKDVGYWRVRDMDHFT